MESYRTNARPDEILFLQHCDQATLNEKILFLRKVKKHTPNPDFRKIEEKIPSQQAGLISR